MRYFESYRYVFDSPKWMTNVVAGALAQLVPIVGPMVFMGYGFDIIEALHRNPGSPYPDFDTNQLSRYLTRGVWPFLIRLLASFVVTPVFLILHFGGTAAIMAVAGDDKSQASGAMAAFILVLVFTEVFIGLLVSLVILPLELRAGLAQDFASAFAPAWVIDFFKRTWPQMILAQLFLMATAIPLSLAGFAVCCVGIYFVAPVVILAQFHLWHQLYELYLERGGTPVPLKPEPYLMPPGALEMPPGPGSTSIIAAAPPAPPPPPTPETFQAPKET